MSDDHLALNLNRGASVKVLAFKVRVISSFKVAFVSVFLVFPLPVALLGTRPFTVFISRYGKQC